jgi:hypothetical protein
VTEDLGPTGRGGQVLGTPEPGRPSVAVGAPAGEHAEHVDGARFVVESQQDPPVADAQAPLLAALEFDDVAGGRVGDEAVERLGDALAA